MRLLIRHDCRGWLVFPNHRRGCCGACRSTVKHSPRSRCTATPRRSFGLEPGDRPRALPRSPPYDAALRETSFASAGPAGAEASEPTTAERYMPMFGYILAGTPMAMALVGTSLMTRLLDAMHAPSPTRISPSTTAPAPTNTSLPNTGTPLFMFCPIVTLCMMPQRSPKTAPG